MTGGKNLLFAAMAALSLSSWLAFAEPERIYLTDKGAGGACSVCLFECVDGGIMATLSGWYHKSIDGGRSWTKMYPYAVGCGAPTGGGGFNTVRLRDGRLMNIGGARTRNDRVNRLGGLNYSAYFSKDEGRTWKDKTPLSDNDRCLYLMNDRPRVLSTGRIVVPVAMHPDELLDKKLETVGWAAVFYSDDDGKTWHEGQWLKPTVADQMSEPAIFERRDGSLKMLARTGKGYLYQSDSRDGGETWSKEYPTTLRSPCAPFFVRKDPYTGFVFVAWDNSFPAPAHQYPRSPLSLGVSRDDGETWHFVCDIENDPMSSYGYPTIFFTKDTILVAYYEQRGCRVFDGKEQRSKLTIFKRSELNFDKTVKVPLKRKSVKKAK